MSELELSTLDELKTEVIILSKQMASHIIEIGKRLSLMKEKVGRGNWGQWVEDNLPFSQQHAWRFMKIAEEYKNLTPGLNYKKMFLLLDIPSEERQAFIDEPHEVKGEPKTVDDMTTRELQKAIADTKVAEGKTRLAEEKAKQIEKQLKDEQDYSEEKEKEITQLTQQINKVKAQKPEIQTKEVIPEDYAIIKQKMNDYEKERRDNQDKVFNASKLVMAMQDLNFDCNAKLLNAANKLEQDAGATINNMLGLFKTANGIITQQVHNRISASITGMYQLLKVIEDELNLKGGNVINVEEFKHI